MKLLPEKVTLQEANALEAATSIVKDLDVELALKKAELQKMLYVLTKKYKLKDDDSLEFETGKIIRAKTK